VPRVLFWSQVKWARLVCGACSVAAGLFYQQLPPTRRRTHIPSSTRRKPLP
jgi:hypothetical protein